MSDTFLVHGDILVRDPPNVPDGNIIQCISDGPAASFRGLELGSLSPYLAEKRTWWLRVGFLEVKSGGRQAPHGHPSEVTATLTPSNPKPALTCFFYQLLGTSQLPQDADPCQPQKGGAGGVVYIHDLFSCSMHARSQRMEGKLLVRCTGAARLTTSINRWSGRCRHPPTQWSGKMSVAVQKTTDAVPNAVPCSLCFVLMDSERGNSTFLRR